jgi:hypothetical protein
MILTDFRLLVGIMAIALVGCRSVQEGTEVVDGSESGESTGEVFALKATFQNHIPYCGGMAPTPEMADGIDEPINGAVYYIYKDDLPASANGFTKVTTDANGMILVNLEAGTYHFIEKDKRLSLEDFIDAKEIIGEHYKNGPETCFERWRLTPDFSINLTKDSEEVISIANRCFTGSNPCLTYTGPYPP